MEPNFEVKLLLKPSKILAPENELASKLRSAFGITTSATQIGVQFLDSNEKIIYNAGWSPRIRKIQDESDLELTYKKRYAITGNDVDAALQMASDAGFAREGKKFKAQVEWGYQKMTLSISHKRSASDEACCKTSLPTKKMSRDMLVSEAPNRFKDWQDVKNWGTNALEVSRIFGPVEAKRWTGNWKGVDVYVEVWMIFREKGVTETVPLVEVSFRMENATEAAAGRGELIVFLREKDWLLEQDSLKTQLVMERY